MANLLSWSGYSRRERIEWLKRAVDAGDTTAIVELGRVHGFGVDVPQDSVQAYTKFFDAAEKGDVQAAFLVGILTVFGLGVDKDVEMGVGFLRTASNGGHKKAMWALANFYMRGICVKQDTALAAHWLHKLAALGDYGAIKLLSRMADAVAPREAGLTGDGSDDGAGPEQRRPQQGKLAIMKRQRPRARKAPARAAADAMDVDADLTHATGPAAPALSGVHAARRPSAPAAPKPTDADLARQLALDMLKIDEHRAEFAGIVAGMEWKAEYARRRQGLDDPTTGALRNRAAQARALRECLRKALSRRHSVKQESDSAH